MSSSSSNSHGMSFSSILTLIFIVLKLCGVINWSWWWVLSPIWISWLIIWGILGFMSLKDWLDDIWDDWNYYQR